VIVVDVSAAVLGLLKDGDSRQALITEDIAIPHLADSEIAHALRAQARRGKVGHGDAERALGRWARVGVRRHAAVGLLPRIWALRENVTAYDATYVALAEALRCPLLTGDARLAAAPGPRCPMVVVRN
jgi:predicted nucleic acid-binding protein